MSYIRFRNTLLTGSALLLGLASMSASAQAEEVDGVPGFAPVPVMQPQSPLLLKANAESFAAGVTSPNVTMSTALISQPLMLMSAAPQADPQIVEKIMAMPAQTASLASTTGFVTAAGISSPQLANAATKPATSAATAAHDESKLELYTKLMALNGTTTNVRMILKNAKEAIRLVVIERAGTVSLTPEQELRYEDVASNILQETESALIKDIAATQSQAFSEAEIQELIKANSSPAAQKYNAAKYVAPAESVNQVQAYMVDAVYKILKNFKQVIAS